MKIIKNFWWIILIGFLFRIIIASLTFHPDIRNTSIASTIIFREQTLNPYQYSGKDIYIVEKLDDLPLAYFITLPINRLLRPLIDTRVEEQFLKDTSVLFGNSVFYLYLLIVKVPVLIYDLALGILLATTVAAHLQKKILAFWMFNPFILWTSAAIGQFDVIPTLFLLVGYLLMTQKKLGLAAFSLGLAAAVKSFGFLLAPFLILMAKNWSERIKLMVIFVTPWILSVLPYLSSTQFRSNALLAPQLDKILFSKILLSGGEAVLIVPTILIVLYLLYLRKARLPQDFLIYCLVGLLMVLTFTHFHLQWFSWVIPFLVILYFQGLTLAQKWSLGLISLSLILMLFLFDASLSVRLFAPIFPNLKDVLGLAEILRNEQLIMLRSLAASLFGASSIYLSLSLLLKHEQS